MLNESSDEFKIEVYNAVGDAAFFRRLLLEWATGARTVELYSAVSEAKYRSAAGLFQRLALRWRMYPGYAWNCWQRERKRSDHNIIRIATTNPFFIPALLTRASGSRGSTVNLLYDLYPDALIQAGKISAQGFLAQRSAALTRFSLRHCEATVFLGDHLREYTEKVYGPARRAAVIPVGADGTPFRDFPPRSDARPNPVILYSGQLGRMHDANTIAEALKSSWSGVEFIFRASGFGYRSLRKSVGDRDGLDWGASLPDPEWQSAMKNAAIALVTIAEGAERVVMPSKTYSALVAGQAILAICPRRSDLADLVHRHDCGWVVEPGDVASVVQLIDFIAKHPAAVLAKRRKAFEAGHAYYEMGVVAHQWRRLFGEIRSARNERRTPLHAAQIT